MTPEVEAKLLEDVGYIKAKVETLATAAAKDDKRIRSLERRMWLGSGFVAAVTAYIVPSLRAKLGV